LQFFIYGELYKSEIEADKIKELNNAAWHIQCEISTATTTTK